jgi:uncharacterized protein YwgA
MQSSDRFAFSMEAVSSQKASEKTGTMLYAISKFAEVRGKKALQKIVYFVNINSKCFAFRWHSFGPYSEELKYELDTAIVERMVRIEEIPMGEGVQYNMQLTTGGRRTLRAIRIGKETKDAVDIAFRILNHKSPREMELLASVHYIINENKGRPDEESIWNLISELKPEANFTLEDVKRVTIQLRNNGLVS